MLHVVVLCRLLSCYSFRCYSFQLLKLLFRVCFVRIICLEVWRMWRVIATITLSVCLTLTLTCLCEWFGWFGRACVLWTFLKRCHLVLSCVEDRDAFASAYRASPKSIVLNALGIWFWWLFPGSAWKEVGISRWSPVYIGQCWPIWVPGIAGMLVQNWLPDRSSCGFRRVKSWKPSCAIPRLVKAKHLFCRPGGTRSRLSMFIKSNIRLHIIYIRLQYIYMYMYKKQLKKQIYLYTYWHTVCVWNLQWCFIFSSSKIQILF